MHMKKFSKITTIWNLRSVSMRMYSCEEGRLDIANGSYIGYKKRNGQKDKPGIIFCAGFLSNLDGTKAVFLDEYCKRNNLSCLRFDYIGHTFSSGTMDDFSIALWKQNTLDVLDNLTEGQQILVGSSMGGWISLLVAAERSERIHSLITISNAADIMIPKWEISSIRTIALLGVYFCKLKIESIFSSDSHGEKSEMSDETSTLKPVRGAPSFASIFDAQNSSVFSQEQIPILCPVRLLHGTNDNIVPYNNSLKIAELLVSEDVQVSLVKDAEHRFSSEANLTLLGSILDELLN